MDCVLNVHVLNSQSCTHTHTHTQWSHTGAGEDPSLEPGWSILRDGYMKSKSAMKDWEDEDNDSSEQDDSSEDDDR